MRRIKPNPVDLRRVAQSLWVAAVLASCPPALAQNAPLSALPARGAVQPTDIIPIEPAAGPQLMQTPISALSGALGGCAGVTPGSYTNANITVTAAGCLTAAANGSSGAGAVTGVTASLADYACATTGAGALTITCTVNASGVAAGTYANPSTLTVDAGGRVTAIAAGCGQQCTAPNLLKFGPPTVLPYYDPQPAGLIDVTDNFATTGTFTQSNGGNVGTFSVASNVGSISSGSALAAMYFETSDTTLVAPQAFVSLETVAIPMVGSSYSNVGPAIGSGWGNWVAVIYDAQNHIIQFEAIIGGSFTTSGSYSVTFSSPFYLGMEVNQNSITAWYKYASDPSGHWSYVGSYAYGGDLTASGALAGFHTGFVIRSGGGASYQIANLSGGRGGGVSLRDIKPVVNPDWTTYQPGSNTIYFTASVNDPTGQGSEGVFTLNLSTQQITETGVICDARNSHVYCGDGSGHVIYHSNGDREVLESTWATGMNNSTPVKMIYQYLTNGAQPDVLTNNLSVLSLPTVLNLPEGASGLGAYDGALGYDTVNSRYLMAYTICNDCTFANATTATSFYPALAYASTPTGTWTSIGMDTAELGNWEGTSLANVGGVLYELAGGPHFSFFSGNFPACTSSRIYNEAFAYQGALLGATFGNTVASSNLPCPHPTLFQHPDGQHMVMFTFDDTEWTGGEGFSTGRPMIEISTP